MVDDDLEREEEKYFADIKKNKGIRLVTVLKSKDSETEKKDMTFDIKKETKKHKELKFSGGDNEGLTFIAVKIK